jgi:hypothetical protein
MTETNTIGAFKSDNSPYDGRDELLQVLAHLANDTGISTIPITLNVGGVLISGLTISHDEYAKNYVETIRGYCQSLPEEFKTDVEEKYLKQIFLEASEATELNSIDESTSENKTYFVEDTIYIHLKDTRFYSPGGNGTSIPGTGGTVWRGRIDSVSGFFFGVLEATRANEAHG